MYCKWTLDLLHNLLRKPEILGSVCTTEYVKVPQDQKMIAWKMQKMIAWNPDT